MAFDRNRAPRTGLVPADEANPGFYLGHQTTDRCVDFEHIEAMRKSRAATVTSRELLRSMAAAARVSS